MESSNRKSGSGGARPGAGRPRVGKFTRSVFCTDKVWMKVRKIVAELNDQERQAWNLAQAALAAKQRKGGK